MNSTPVLSNKTYDRLKWTTTIVLPALAALYFGFSEIWGLPKGTEVVGSIAVLATFLGTLLGISSKSYDPDADVDGELVLKGRDPDTGQPHLGMVINKMPDELLGKKTVRLNVGPHTEESTL